MQLNPRLTFIGLNGFDQPSCDAASAVAVLDPDSNLMWAIATLPKRLNWADAAEACKNLTVGGFTDWRLPTVEELFLLADRSRFNPAIDTEIFPDTKSDCYWTSTPDASAPQDCAWSVYFYYGYSHLYAQYDYAFVRAVRSASASQ